MFSQTSYNKPAYYEELVQLSFYSYNQINPKSIQKNLKVNSLFFRLKLIKKDSYYDLGLYLEINIKKILWL